MKNLLVRGNKTMPKSVGIWNLPAEITCTPSLWCLEHCYAKKGRFCWSNVVRSQYERYERTFDRHFHQDMWGEIANSKLRYVRVHIAGDFYSREYVKDWAGIARRLPKVLFRTNTRRRDLMPLINRIVPNNFVVRESIDPTRKSTGYFPSHAIVGTKGSEDFFVCKNDCEKCKFYCWKHPEIDVVSEKIL